MGYAGISNVIAVEFDTYYNPDLLDPYENHVSVQTRRVNNKHTHTWTVLLPKNNNRKRGMGLLHRIFCLPRSQS